MQAILEMIAKNSVPTKEEAERYVFNVESAWGQEGITIRSTIRRVQGVWTRRVETPSNDWDVWYEPCANGRYRVVYGEC